MLAFLKKNAATCRTLLVEKTDRLYRNLKDWVTLDDCDLEIHFVKENVVLSPDARSGEKFMHGIKVLMAKNYIDNLSEEVRKGMHEKASQGFWPHQAPLGYRNVTWADGRKIIEPHPDLAPIIRHLFEWYATGKYSLKEVARMAREEGLVFPRSRNSVPLTTVHKILRDPLFYGDFNWGGKHYRGNHEPLVSRQLWDRVQAALERRHGNRHRKVRHDFAFARLVQCGHCGCALVGELKKGKYIYYHCTGYKGKCPERFTREEVLAERFADLLRGLTFEPEVLTWVSTALRESHADQKHHHQEAIGRLRAEYDRLQQRLDAMYVDKLDGKIDAALYDRKAAEWQGEQDRLKRALAEHEMAGRTYLEEGVKLLELSQRAAALFEKQEPGEKRRLLDFVLSNCTWKNGELRAEYRQPFDLIADANKSKEPVGAESSAKSSRIENYYARRDSNP